MTDRLFRSIPLQFFAEKPEETGGEAPAVETIEPVEKVTEVTAHVDPVGAEGTAPVTIEGAEGSVHTIEFENLATVITGEVETSEKDAEIAQLQQDLAEANQKIAELTEANVALTATVEDSGKSVESATANAEAYQKSLETIVAEKEKDIPEDIKALMPENISVTEKLEWLTKAETLKPKEEEKAEVITAIGRPTPVTEQVVDQSELTPIQRMANYFGSK